MEFQFLSRKIPVTFAGTDAQVREQVQHDVAAEKARIYAEEAVMTLVGLMRGSKDDRVKLKAATTLIERAYGAPKQVVESNANESIIEVLARISTSAGEVVSKPLPQDENPVFDAITGKPDHES